MSNPLTIPNAPDLTNKSIQRIYLKNMPIQKGKSQKVISQNIRELVATEPSAKRAKGIATLASRRGISKEKAQQVQAAAIAYSKARESGAKIPYKGKKWRQSDTGKTKA